MSLAKTEPDRVLADHPAASKTALPFTVRSFGLTDPGRVRPANEDHFAIVELARTMRVHHTSLPQAKPQYSSHRALLLLVAAGMGGHRAGEVASAMSVVSL